MDAAMKNSPDVLCQRILAQSRSQEEEILRNARTKADAVLAAATAEAEKIRQDRRKQALAEAARRKELILATVAVEAGRIRAARIETLVESVRSEISRKVGSGEFDACDLIVRLGAEVLRKMAGTDFTGRVSLAAYAAFGNDLAEKITAMVGRPVKLTISPDPTVTSGVVLRSVDGFQAWDNQLSSRLNRLWPELRRQIAVQAAFVEQLQTGGDA